MKVTILQQHIAWQDASANRRQFEAALASAPASDLYVLPEMWNTGFVADPSPVAETDDGESVQWMLRMARRLDAAVAGSMAIRTDGGDYRNRFFFATPDGIAGRYDKRHLFSYGGEDKHYRAGDKRVVVAWRGVRFLLQVCYDLRFPVWSRYYDDYDAILYVANWPSSRHLAWHTLLRARAIENQCYVVGVNRVGSDPVCDYQGSSAFVTPYGDADECPAGAETSLTGTIDMPFLEHFREKFPVLKERDCLLDVRT